MLLPPDGAKLGDAEPFLVCRGSRNERAARHSRMCAKRHRESARTTRKNVEIARSFGSAALACRPQPSPANATDLLNGPGGFYRQRKESPIK